MTPTTPMSAPTVARLRLAVTDPAVSGVDWGIFGKEGLWGAGVVDFRD